MQGGVQIVSLKNNLEVARFAFIVPTKVDKRATVRNRIKRLLREQVRKFMPQLPIGRDVVIIARTYDEKVYSQSDSLLSALSVS